MLVKPLSPPELCLLLVIAFDPRERAPLEASLAHVVVLVDGSLSLIGSLNRRLSPINRLIIVNHVYEFG